jgi:hypothetical protein
MTTAGRPTNPDPEDSKIPGLEPGGGVDPGDTPPIAATTSQSANKDPIPKGNRFTASSVTGIAIVVVSAVVFLIIAVFLVMYLVGKY